MERVIVLLLVCYYTGDNHFDETLGVRSGLGPVRQRAGGDDSSHPGGTACTPAFARDARRGR